MPDAPAEGIVDQDLFGGMISNFKFLIFPKECLRH